jgi:hypothetical protein
MKQIGLLGKYTDLTIAFHAKQMNYPIFAKDKYFNGLAKKKIIKLFSI